MQLSKIKLRAFLWFLTSFSIAMAYPLQVKVMGTWPTMIPYLFIILSLLIVKVRLPKKINLFTWNGMDLLVYLFISLVLFHAFWQVIFGLLSFNDAARSIFIFIFPTILYIYFSRYSIELEIKAVLLAIIISGIISGVFFTYDSINKLAFGKISQYSMQAETYEQMRANILDETTSGRAQLNYRSQGLLKTHTVSSIWIIFAILAVLAFIRNRKNKLRLIAIFLFGSMLIIGLNFTSIIGFILLIFIVEFQLLSILYGKLYKSVFKGVNYMFIFGIIFFILSIIFINSDMRSFMIELIQFQLEILTIGNETFGKSYLEVILNYFEDYKNQVLRFPPILLIGDGFTNNFGNIKGGDFGFMETLSRLGIPFCFISVYFMCKKIVTIFNKSFQLRKKDKFNNKVLITAAGFIFMILFTELHYTTWTDKSVLPLFFFALGIIRRYYNNFYDNHVLSKASIATLSRRYY